MLVASDIFSGDQSDVVCQCSSAGTNNVIPSFSPNQIRSARVMDGPPLLSSAFPLPPMSYIDLFTDDNIRQNSQILQPPPPIEVKENFFPVAGCLHCSLGSLRTVWRLRERHRSYGADHSTTGSTSDPACLHASG